MMLDGKAIRIEGVSNERDFDMASTAVREFLGWQYRSLVNENMQSAAMRMVFRDSQFGPAVRESFTHETPDAFVVFLREYQGEPTVGASCKCEIA